MHWLFWVALAIFLYAAVAAYAYSRKAALAGEGAGHGGGEKSPWDAVVFYGPVMALKTERVGFFDRYARHARFLRAYATVGVAMVAVISAGIAAILFLSVRLTFLFKPEPTGIYAPQNIFLIPGINEYVPSTLAVWFAFVLTIAVHEWGHGILCRVENIRVRSMGALLAVIPVGFFVEPDEEELERTRGMPKIRMFGAGITNNIVVGIACFVAMVLLFGMVVPTESPVIAGVYKDYPAWQAGVPTPSVIAAIDGIPVGSRDDVSRILASSRPGDRVTLTVRTDSGTADYPLVLSEWPKELGPREAGFMGISYYDGALVKQAVRESLSLPGLIGFLTIPFDPGTAGRVLRVLAFETPETGYYEEPFPMFWGIIHLLFWCAWININVGIFNAIPMVPLDGGYILKEAVERLFERLGLSNLALPVVSLVSSVMVVMLLSLVLLPYVLHM
ncbi:MAG: site-2 protease family protein [Methanolinea sp.]